MKFGVENTEKNLRIDSRKKYTSKNFCKVFKFKPPKKINFKNKSEKIK